MWQLVAARNWYSLFQNFSVVVNTRKFQIQHKQLSPKFSNKIKTPHTKRICRSFRPDPSLDYGHLPSLFASTSGVRGDWREIVLQRHRSTLFGSQILSLSLAQIFSLSHIHQMGRGEKGNWLTSHFPPRRWQPQAHTLAFLDRADISILGLGMNLATTLAAEC